MQSKIEKRRLISVFAIICCIFAVFLVHLFRLQITQNESADTVVSVVEVPVEAVRGDILDRNGYPLATNKKVNKIVFNYAYFPKDYAERNKIILKLITIFNKNKTEWNDNLPIEVTKKGELRFVEGKENEVSYLKSEAFLDLNYYATVQNCFGALVSRYELEPYPVKQARDIASVYYYMVKSGFNPNRKYEFATEVSNELVSLLKEKAEELPGVEIDVTYERDYPDGTLAPHVLGRIGALTPEEYETKKEEGYGLNDYIGKSGVESALESYLRGTNGVMTITTDAEGNKTEEYTVEPVPGNTVMLTIDKDIQKVAQNALASGIKKLQTNLNRIYPLTGAVVVMDTRNNDCLAIASYPNYNNSTYDKNSEKLNKDESKPLWNRALRSTYSPGSTVKPAVSIAGLEEGVVKDDTYIYCSGIYKHYKDYQPGCTGVHGGLNVVRAIYHSCNIYFYETARRLGIEKLNSYFKMFGLGEPTGIELYESTGTVDSVEFRENRGEIWTPGLTIQAGIGHADNRFTPIQLCSYVSTIANRGVRYKAHVVKGVKSPDLSETIMQSKNEILSQADFKKENWDLVHEGMLLVGTQSYANFSNAPVKVAAKTGTTTVFKRVNGAKIETYNGFLITFAPYENPEIAICVAVEGAGSGGSTAPIAAAIMEYYFRTSSADENNLDENTLLK
ncbi:MAG: penicillin-binding protein [Clostridia bacterium]|nr:penicillin-binding protein [Clostridia bacterium]